MSAEPPPQSRSHAHASRRSGLDRRRKLEAAERGQLLMRLDFSSTEAPELEDQPGLHGRLPRDLENDCDAWGDEEIWH